MTHGLLVVFSLVFLYGCETMMKGNSGDHDCTMECTKCEHVKFSCNLGIERTDETTKVTAPI